MLRFVRMLWCWLPVLDSHGLAAPNCNMLSSKDFVLL